MKRGAWMFIVLLLAAALAFGGGKKEGEAEEGAFRVAAVFQTAIAPERGPAHLRNIGMPMCSCILGR